MKKVALFAIIALSVLAGLILFTDPAIGGAMLATFPLVMSVGKLNLTVKSQEEKDELDRLINLMNAITEKAVAGFITAEEAAQKIADKIAEKGFKLEDNEEFKTYAAAVIAQGIAIKALQEKGAKTGQTIGEQIKEQIEKNKSGWEDFLNKKSQKFEFQLNTKTVGTMTPSVSATGGAIPYQFIPGITPIADIQPFLVDLIGIKPTTSPTIYWSNKTNREGTTAFVADTGTLAQIDFVVTAEASTAKNVGAFIKIHENMMNDIPYITSEIQSELLFQVNHLCDSEVLSGTGLTVHLKGITVYAATGFSLTTLKIKSPNTYDAILAAATQIKTLNFMPNIVLLNPIDYANMVGAKDNQAGYVLPPFATAAGQVVGLTVYQSNLITAGDVIVMDSTKCNIYELGNMVVEAGFEGSDFKDMTRTFRAYRRLHHFISDNNTGAFVYDTIDDIKAAITEI